MFFLESKVFYTWNASRIELFIFNFLLSRRDLHATGVLFQTRWCQMHCMFWLCLRSAVPDWLWFLARTFKIPRWGHVALSVSYALISFITAHSEIIMWLDAFVYLPLVILGIHRVMDLKRPKLYLSVIYSCFIQFYMGFMIGVFSFLYLSPVYWQTGQNIKTIVPYGITSLLAGGASMIIVLPAVLDLRSNGEALSQITTLKTEATSYLDLIMKIWLVFMTRQNTDRFRSFTQVCYH